MKYIRTKGGIGRAGNDTKKYDWISDVQILGVANTIEELCDEFVIPDYINPLYKDFETAKMHWQYRDKVVYGAIWTDKGLIYVAKMNDKGELELL